ncbi:MAG: DUF4340 domain-containing protein [Candidatus Omnitrophica bacterium]|nr:DUF4340 domain-containing protein [Candidatus Omnitrophota bacterium]
MKLTRTIVFILLFALVVAIYLFQVRLNKQALTIIPDEVNRTVVISKNDLIDRVELRDNVQKTQIALRKKNGVWALERPVRYPAESQIIEGFTIAARMASQQPRLRAEKEWSEYGLATPDLEIQFGLPGKRAVTLLIGAEAPVGKAVFAKWAEERGFFLLQPEMKSMFRQSVYALRQKRLFRTPADKIQKITVEMGEHSYQWKKDGGVWYWFEPVEKLGQKIPEGRLDLVLGGLQSLHVREFLDNNKKSKAELGFFMIHDRIWVETEDGPPEKQDEARPSSQGGKKEAFYFGNEVPEKNAYYGFREGEDVVFLVDRAKVIELFDLMKKVQMEEPKLETKDLRPQTKDLTPRP